jgi:hypothetical protein
MRTILLSVLVSLALLNNIMAQTPQPKGLIKGMLIDSANNQPLAFVTVVLKDAKTSQAERSVLSKDNGSFEILAPINKAYQLVFAFIGYKTKTVNVPAFAIGDKPSVNMQRILLSPTNGQLKEVAITDFKPLMKQEVDRITYDVQADPESKATSALDMMRKVPLLAVDANDAITLKGSGNYKILINGKESALMAKNPSDVLKAMPASNIEKVEVITTPPAKYDAEGLSGIINIITKKNADQGYNVGINGRMNSLYGPGININGTVKQGKFGLAGYMGYSSNGHQDNQFGKTQLFTADQSLLLQNGTSAYSGNNKYGDAELSYEPDTLNLITSSVEFYSGDNNQGNQQLSKQFTGSNILSQQYSLNNTGHNTNSGFDAALNYQLGFKKSKDQLLTVSYKYIYSPNKQFNDNSFFDVVNFAQPNYQQYNNSGNKSHTVQLDYVQPFNKTWNTELGGKVIMRNNFSDFETSNFSPIANQYIADPTQTNNFDYHQDVYSLYNSYQLKLSKWTGKAGLRLEHTTINANFISVGQSVNQGYNNLIPSISLQRSMATSSINLGFTERIQRPGIYQLNPFVDQTNPKFTTTGNPNLRPELNHTFDLTYSNFSKASVTAGLSYAFSNNSIQNVSNTTIQTEAGGKKDTVTNSTYQNLGSNTSLGFNLNTNLTLIQTLTISLNANIQHVWLKGAYNGTLYKNDGYTGSAFLSAGYKFAKSYRIGFNAGFYSGNVTLQGQSSSFIYNSYVFTREFFNKNATLSLVANNPYSKYSTYHSTTNTADFAQTSFNQNRYSTFALRFSYKFGRLNSEIKKSERGINNDDSKGGGSTGSSSK